jgi:hypothetical protein
VGRRVIYWQKNPDTLETNAIIHVYVGINTICTATAELCRSRRDSNDRHRLMQCLIKLFGYVAHQNWLKMSTFLKPNNKNCSQKSVTMNTKATVFCVVAPCGLVEIYQRFRGLMSDRGSTDLWNFGLHGATIHKAALFIVCRDNLKLYACTFFYWILTKQNSFM